MDDYLEVNVDRSRPSVIFESDILKSGLDTLVLLGLENAGVYKGVQQRSLGLYLKNTNSKIVIKNKTGDALSTTLPFTELRTDNLGLIRDRFPQLRGMTVYALCLNGLTVEKNMLNDYAVLGDGEFISVSYRNRLLIQDRKISIVIEEVNQGESAFYESLAGSSFQSGDD
jgi:hypothetical protein